MNRQKKKLTTLHAALAIDAHSADAASHTAFTAASAMVRTLLMKHPITDEWPIGHRANGREFAMGLWDGGGR